MQETEIEKIRYEKDFYGWIMQQIEFIKDKKIEYIDIENIAKQLEFLASRERQKIWNKVIELIKCFVLVKLGIFHTQNSSPYDEYIFHKRFSLQVAISNSPSLESKFEKKFNYIYKFAIDEMKDFDEKFGHQISYPESPFFTFSDLFDDNYLPE